MSQCAYRLGLAFGEAAERAEETARQIEYFQLFDRCFFAVRIATALELRLGRGPMAFEGAAFEGPTDREDLSVRAEHDPLERDVDLEREREYDREREPASLPLLLRTLNGVAVEAAALPGPEPAELPNLRELLAHAAPAAAPRPHAAGLRARLAGSGAAAVMTARPAARPALGPAASVRQPTGPPRR